MDTIMQIAIINSDSDTSVVDTSLTGSCFIVVNVVIIYRCVYITLHKLSTPIGHSNPPIAKQDVFIDIYY